MRRRRVLESAALAFGVLAGCLGSRSTDTRTETTVERDWEPTGEPGDAPSATPASTGRNGSSASATETGTTEPTGREATGDDRTDPRTRTPRPDREPAFANSSDWDAERAQVAANDRAAGEAVEFLIETAPLESCGTTCRELRAALTNAGTRTAHDVQVHTEVRSAGRIVRERNDRVGDLPAGETYRAHARVELGPVEALRVREAGTITVEQVVTSTERRELFERRIDVS